MIECQDTDNLCIDLWCASSTPLDNSIDALIASYSITPKFPVITRSDKEPTYVSNAQICVIINRYLARERIKCSQLQTIPFIDAICRKSLILDLLNRLQGQPQVDVYNWILLVFDQQASSKKLINTLTHYNINGNNFSRKNSCENCCHKKRLKS